MSMENKQTNKQVNKTAANRSALDQWAHIPTFSKSFLTFLDVFIPGKCRGLGPSVRPGL